MREGRTWLAVAAVGGVGMGASLAVGRLFGMQGGDLLRLVVTMGPSLVATVVAASIARPLLARSRIVWRMVAIATAATAIGLANLVVVSGLMFVSRHDALVVAVILGYALAAGIGTALILVRSSRGGIERLVATARRIGGGDLQARVGPLEAEPEVQMLAVTIDNMAMRLARSIEREREVEGMRRDLLTAVSHDLRTPLSSLKAATEALGQGIVQDPTDVRRYVDEMRAAVDALIALVDDLFEIVGADGAGLASAGDVRFESVVDSAITICEPLASAKGIEVRTELDGARDVLCSPRLERVLQNLLVNAVRHTHEGEITVRARLHDEDLIVEVSDTGEGIAASHLARVFEPFWRGDAARSSPGSGLGLTLAQRIVEHLGGRIWATSEPGAGATFTVILPARPAGGGRTERRSVP